jgi:hypothetical protein
MMTDITKFKEIASTKLPKSLYQQLEPHLDGLFDSIEMEDEFNYRSEEANQERLRDLKIEFEESFYSMWPDFARERWPEIDHYFILEESNKYEYLDIPDIPF